LHNNGYVADETRVRVETVLAETGYRLNTLARGLRKQKTFTIGHLLHSISPNPFFAGVALGVEQEAKANGYGVLLYNSHGDPAREKLGVEKLIGRRADAILFSTPVDAANVELALSADIPVVQVERPTCVSTHAVLVDNYSGSLAAVEHLISLGHRRIAFIGGDPDYYHGDRDCPDPERRLVEEQRLAGYLDALRNHQLSPDDSLISLGQYYTVEDGGFDGFGYRCMRDFLQRSPHPTAVFASCDILAAGALQAIYGRSLRVPDDISVVGFDNTYAPYLSPPLTTVEQPMLDIGRTAARLVFDLIQPDDQCSYPTRIETLSTRLIVRASTGPVPIL
jgi:DNA-binding LacI/PurR family transcriptional regulator